MQSLEKRLTELERSLLPQPTRTAVLMPDEGGRYPKPPAGAAMVIRVEFVEVAHHGGQYKQHQREQPLAE